MKNKFAIVQFESCTTCVADKCGISYFIYYFAKLHLGAMFPSYLHSLSTVLKSYL